MVSPALVHRATPHGRCNGKLVVQGILLVSLGVLMGHVQAGYVPARLRTGTVAPPPPQIIGGGQVWLEVSVGQTGAVAGTETLRTVDPFGAALQTAVRGWRFQPARLDDEPVEAAVLVAGVFRPPSLFVFGDSSVAADAGAGRAEAPRPTTAVMPPYPPTGRGTVSVIVEVGLNGSGEMTGADVKQSGGSAFDEAALDTARRWRFTPGRHSGRTTETFVYLVFVFREPVVVPPRRD